MFLLYGYCVYKSSHPGNTTTKVKLSWKKTTGVSGYYLYRANKKKGKYRLIKLVKKAKTVSFTDRKRKGGKKYYYKIQPFTKLNGKTVKGRLSAPVMARAKK